MQQLQAQHVIRGYEGALYHDGELLVEVNEYTANVTITNTDLQPIRSKLVLGVTTGYSVGLNFTETVIRDVVLLKKLLDHIAGGSGSDVRFDFMTEIIRESDGAAGRIAYRSCEPDGTIDLQAISSGDIVRRSWSFRVNEAPDLQDLLDVA